MRSLPRFPAPLIIAASKPAPAITAKRSPLNRPASRRTRRPRRPTPTASGYAWDAEIRGEEVGGSGGDDREHGLRCRRARRRSAAPSVAAPGEHKVGPLVDRPAKLGRSLAALRHLGPEGVGDALGREHAAQLGQPAAERLPRVRDDGDPHRRSTSRAAAPPGGAAGEDGERERADSEQRTSRNVERVVHPAVYPRHAHVTRDGNRERPESVRRPGSPTWR